MNWLVLGGGALLVIWLAGRRVAKRDGEPVEPIFGTGESSNSGGDGFYGGFGGGDGLAIAGQVVSPKSDEPKSFGSRSLVESFVDGLGFGSLQKTDEQVDLPDLPDRPVLVAGPADIDLPARNIPRSATIANATSNSTEFGASTLSMSSLPSLANNDRAVSTAVQAQPPRSFSSVAASISEKSMLPAMVASPAPAAAVKPVSQVVTRTTVDQSIPVRQQFASQPMTVQDSFLASIRPSSVSLRPTLLTSTVRR